MLPTAPTDSQTVTNGHPPAPTDTAPDTRTVDDRQADRAADRVTDAETVTDGRGAWLSPRDAQLALGISERTLFRRIARGELQRRHRADGATEVWVPDARPSVTDAETVDDRHARTAEVERGLVLVDRFGQAVAQQVAPILQELTATRQQLVALARENGELTAENRRLAAQIAALEQRLTATVSETVGDGHTGAPADDSPRHVGDHQHGGGHRAEPVAALPWWQRLLWWRSER